MTIIKADPEVRRKAIYLAVFVTLIGVVVIQFGIPYFEAYLHNLPPKKALQLLNIGLSICCFSIIPFGFYFYRFGRKAIYSEQCPPPGTGVIHDTKIHTGLAARRRGLMLVVVGALIMVMGLFASLYFPYMIGKTTNDPIVQKKSNEGLHRLPQTSRTR